MVNNSRYTLGEIKAILPILLRAKRGYTISPTFCNSSLGELDLNKDFNIKVIDVDKGLVYVEFDQFIDDTIEGWGLNYEYETIQSLSDVDDVLQKMLQIR